jgi:hypothetical protein
MKVEGCLPQFLKEGNNVVKPDKYKYGDVESIESYGSSVEVEIYDSDTGEYRTFEMDR